MTQREKEYLEAHNVRRKRYHTKWGKEEDYVPLKWSPKLQRLAQIVSPCLFCPVCPVFPNTHTIPHSADRFLFPFLLVRRHFD